MSAPPGAPAPLILVADDQADVLEALRLLLKAEGYRTVTAHVPEGILALVEHEPPDCALIDLNYTRDTTSGREGMDLLSRLRVLDPTVPVIVMTAWGSVERVVEAMQLGARDFVEKPWDNTRLLSSIRNQVDWARAIRLGERLARENEALKPSGAPPIVAESPGMRAVLALADRVAPSEATVLLTGEHGTGKEVVARRIHAASTRAHRPLVTVNVGGLAEGVFESELFGHVKGAFTDAKTDRVGRFELADGGTLFLDEIANLTLAQQARLLRVLQTGELERIGDSRTRRVDVRLLVATNADLRAEVAAGRFREDLFFRLNTIEINLPPLRERREEIAVLAQYFLTVYAAKYRSKVAGLSSSALALLEHAPWPGNVRELDHTIERAVLLARGPRIEAADLALPRVPGTAPASSRTLDDIERDAIREALARTGGNVEEAAKELGLSRSAMYRRIERHGL